MGLSFSKFNRSGRSINYISSTRTRSSSHAAPPPPIDTVLLKPYTNITALYDLGKKLGRGKFGIIYLCTEKSTGRKYACKSISRKKLLTPRDRKDARREIMILEHLTGQPNIVEFKGAYEDRKNLHLVMELCSGGELTKKEKYSERDVARIGRHIVNVVQACHFMGVMHRDLKLENFLMVTRDKNSSLKVIDFGVSVFIEEGKVYKDEVGTPYYVAPEVLQGEHGKEIDMWSAGVILYKLLTGTYPFRDGRYDKKGVFKKILEGNIDLQLSQLSSMSDGAKDLIKKMLTKDPKQRITAAQALEHSWLNRDGEASDKPIDSAVLIRMKQLRDMNNLKKLALRVIAEDLSSKEVKGLTQMFINMDTDGSGYITYEELKTGLYKLGSKLSEEEIHQLFKTADIDKNGSLDYIEFFTATMDPHKPDKEENLQKAFRHFHEDNSGYITKNGLKQALTQYGMGDEASFNKVLEDVNIDKDGKINYGAFVAMMRSGTI